MSALPQYHDEERAPLLMSDIKAPLLMPEEEGILRVGEEPKGWCARLRARCAQRKALRRAQQCDNARCQKRRKIGKFIFRLLFVVFLFHVFRGAYHLYTLPKHVECQELTDANVLLDLPLTKSVVLLRSLSSGDSGIVRSTEDDSENFHAKLEFESIDKDHPAKLCIATFKKTTILGVFPGDDEDSTIPQIVSAKLTVPTTASKLPSFVFFGDEGRHCERFDKAVGRALRWYGF